MANNYSLLMMITIMVAVNIGFGLYDNAIQSYNPEFNSSIDYSNTVVATMTLGGNLSSDLIIDNELAIPASADSVDVDSGNIFTDIYKSVTNWASRLDDKYSMITGILNQPYGFLKNIGVPIIYATAFGLLWYSILIILLVAFFKGGGAD